MLDIFKSKTKIGYAVSLKFQITQHIREIKLMESLVMYLNCGRISKRSNVVDFIVKKFSDIELKIIPLFEIYCPLVLCPAPFGFYPKTAVPFGFYQKQRQGW